MSCEACINKLIYKFAAQDHVRKLNVVDTKGCWSDTNSRSLLETAPRVTGSFSASLNCLKIKQQLSFIIVNNNHAMANATEKELCFSFNIEFLTKNVKAYLWWDNYGHKNRSASVNSGIQFAGSENIHGNETSSVWSTPDMFSCSDTQAGLTINNSNATNAVIGQLLHHSRSAVSGVETSL